MKICMKKILQHKKMILSLLTTAVVILFVWAQFFKKSEVAPIYQTTTAERGTLIASVTTSGQVSTTNSRTIDTSVTGVVKTIFVKNEQTVKAGDKIAEIDLDQSAQNAYTQALSAYQSAKNSLASAQANVYTTQANMFDDWDSYKKLAESDSYKDTTSPTRSLPEFHISQNTWLASEAQYKNQQAAVLQAQTALNTASQSLKMVSPILYAPISGKITGLSLMKGAVISGETSIIARVITDALPTVTVNLTEVDAPKIQLDNKATITLDALADKTYTGKIISIDTTGSVSSGVTSYPAVIMFDTAAPEVFGNMSAQASIITDTKTDVISIPTSAIQTANGQTTVRIMKDGEPQQVIVETGIHSDTHTEIISGLSEGDIVITSTAQSNPAASKASTQTTSPFSGFGGAGGAMRMR